MSKMSSTKSSKKIVKYIAIAALLIIMFLVPHIIKTPYYLHLIIMTLIWVIMTSGLNIIQGYAGYVSMCQIAFFGLGAYTSGLLMNHFKTSLPIGMLAAVVMGIVVGTLVGIPTLRTKGHYFSIVTLSFTMLFFTIAKGWYDVTGGIHGFSLPNVEGKIFGYELTTKEGYYYLVLIFVILTIFFVYRLFKSKMGRAIVTIRENEDLAKAIGINTIAVKLLAFDISTVLGCIGGVLYAHYMNYVNPTAFSSGIGMNAILAVMIGGTGTVFGPLVGSAAVIFLPEIMRAAEMYRQLAFGVVLLIIVFFMPKGIIAPVVNLVKKVYGKITYSMGKQ